MSAMTDEVSAVGPGRCLRDEEIEAVRAAAPGAVPEAMARHLAGCARCQERALFGDEPRSRRKGHASPQLPTATRALFFVALMAAVMTAFLYTLQMLAGQR